MAAARRAEADFAASCRPNLSMRGPDLQIGNLPLAHATV